MKIVRTVLGDISPDELGITLCHEHLLVDLKRIFTEPDDPDQKEMAYKPVTMETLGWIRHYYSNSLDNLGLYEEQVAIDELRLYREAGGRALMEVTPVDIGRDPEGLARIAEATDVHVIMGSGYYVFGTHPPDMDERPEEELAAEIAGDVTEGVGDTGIKAGVIGEIGCSWPLAPNERKVLRAAARAQRQTGAALTIHPGRDPAAPAEILEIIGEAGGDVRRTVMGHLDRTIHKFSALKLLAETGCYLEFDMFGLESAYYPFAPVDMPNDGRRIDLIMRLIANGHLDQIVVSHDIAFKLGLTKYGGHGYGHILTNAVPKMKTKGMSEQEIRTILEENPKRALSIG